MTTLLVLLLWVSLPAAPQSPLTLDESMHRWAYEHAPAHLDDQARIEHLFAAMLDENGLGLHERSGHSPTAREAFLEGRADCVGFALLFTALARSVHLPARLAVSVDIEVVGGQRNLRIAEGHVAVQVTASPHADTLMVDFGGIYRPPPGSFALVDDQTVFAIYYSNRGTEALLDGRPASAVVWLESATLLEPDLAGAWLNLGVARGRLGDRHGAIEAYRRALELDPSSAASENLAHLQAR
ncbi:MAG: tetratricopeptide repeat protein [Acidobacteriota bacterium]